jgi:hypothetical protein
MTLSWQLIARSLAREDHLVPRNQSKLSAIRLTHTYLSSKKASQLRVHVYRGLGILFAITFDHNLAFIPIPRKGTMDN